MPTKKEQQIDIENKYQKADPRIHVLMRPGMYASSIEEDVYSTYVFNEELNSIEKKNVKNVPCIMKLLDEVLVNAIDHIVRTKETEGAALVKNIKITIDKKTGEISVFNDGEGIEVLIHPKENVYIPELIFGNLLTSTNYDDSVDKIVGGQNGLGAKITNILSTSFTIETVCSKTKKKYVQTFTNNMSDKTKPSITSCARKPYTKITFTPDYSRFKFTKTNDNALTDDMYSILLKRCYDICALTEADVNVWLNDKKLEYKTFERYADLYLGNKTEHFRVAEKINDRWEIIASYTDTNGFEQVSFVNGIWTMKGGKHVDYIVNQIISKLIELLSKRRKGLEIKPNNIKNHLMVFVKSTINNPTFDSQSKDSLTTPISKFGSKAEISDKFIDKLSKSPLIEKTLNMCDGNNKAAHKKTDGKKETRVRGLAKLDDANKAGGIESSKCTLIITEGDSAKTLALSGLSVVGRDYYGVFPLRGKPFNPKNETEKKISENKEIQDLKKIIGLESGKKYTNIQDLRYGRIMLFADSDNDGSHIKGLVMNMFHTLWPSLLTHPDFIVSMVTPIVKATKGNIKKCFYNLPDYQAWFEETNKTTKNGVNDYKIKYYKGLGTSNDEEAKEYFTNMHIIHYLSDEAKESVNQCFNLLFDKKMSNERKEWIEKYDPQASIQIKNLNEYVTFPDFKNNEFRHFSVSDLRRSIPSMVDGLKPSQRKIMFSAFKRNLVSETKVAQFAGYVSEHSSYHHGEASLQSAIVAMAQDFVGSNNMQLLMPNGMFGSRNQGGHDAAQSRYIYTCLSPITSKTFIKDDKPLLTYLNDDGMSIEPEYYMPIVPLILINGTTGIGTGYSTHVPSFNPLEVINVLKNCINNKGQIDNETDDMLVPWYRGFKGTIKINDHNSKSFSTYGCYNQINASTIEITELPIGTWTENYKEFLEDYIKDHSHILKDFESHCTNTNVHFILYFSPSELKKMMESEGKFVNEFKLVSRNISLKNMHLFNKKGIIQKYDSIAEIIKEFYEVRMDYYTRRKTENLKDIKNQIEKANAKASFIKDVMHHEIKIMGEKKDVVCEVLVKKQYPLIDDSYDYVLKMPIYNLTKEKYEELLKNVDDLNKTLKMYESLTESDIWLNELNQLADHYKSDYEDYIEKLETNKPKKLKAVSAKPKKMTTKKTDNMK